jgi:hypothetical protein
MSIHESSGWGVCEVVRVSGRSGPGPLAAAALSRKLPGVRFGPFRGDEFPVILCLCAWLLLSLLAYLIFF